MESEVTGAINQGIRWMWYVPHYCVVIPHHTESVEDWVRRAADHYWTRPKYVRVRPLYVTLTPEDTCAKLANDPRPSIHWMLKYLPVVPKVTGAPTRGPSGGRWDFPRDTHPHPFDPAVKEEPTMRLKLFTPGPPPITLDEATSREWGVQWPEMWEGSELPRVATIHSSRNPLYSPGEDPFEGATPRGAPVNVLVMTEKMMPTA
jgi:hypothetical protein